MFAIAVWEGGKQVTDSATNIFNITNAATDASSSAVSSTSSTATSTATSISSSSSSSPSATPTVGDGGAGLGTGSDPPAIDQSASAGLSTGAVVGVGIGAAFGGMLLLALAWYLRRRWVKRRQDMVHQGKVELVATEYHAPSNKDYYTGLVEAPPETYRPHELS